MDQERVATKVVDVYKLTGELFLKTMYQMLEGSHQKVKERAESKVFTDKANWNKFMATSETKHFQTFMVSEVNSDRLEEYLKGYEIGFAVKDNKDGTCTIAIDAKNVKALEASFKGVINDLTDPGKAEKLTNNLVKNSKNMNLQEKLAYHKQQVKVEIQAKSVEKAAIPKKTLAKDDRGL